MAIEFDCPHCGEHLSLWDELAGKQGTCPECGQAVVVPRREPDVLMACPKCEADIPAGSVICTHCGVDLKRGTTMETRVNEPGAIEQVATESASQILGMLWRWKLLIIGLAVFIGLVVLLFSLASKRSIGPDLRQLDDNREAAATE